MKNILFLCAETFPPPYAILRQVFNKLLCEKGYRLSWVMPSNKVHNITKTVWEGNKVWLIPKIQPVGVWSLVKDYLFHLHILKQATSQALEENGGFDIIQVRDDPTMAYVAWKISNRFKIPFCYQISHLKEEENILYAKKKLYGNPFKNYLRGKVGLVIRNWLLRRADRVFPVSHQMKTTLTDYGVSPNKMVVLSGLSNIDTSVNPAIFDKASKRIRERFGLQNKSVLIYVGTMNRFRELDFLLRVLKRVQKSISNVHLLMVGEGRRPNDLQWLRKEASKLNIEDNITFTGWVSPAKVPSYIRSADVGLSPIPPNFVYVNSFPIKILEYQALEIPCVASDIPSHRRIIVESKGGVCVPYKEKEFSNAIISLLKFDEEEKTKNGRNFLSDYHNPGVICQRLTKVYDQFESGNRSK